MESNMIYSKHLSETTGRVIYINGDGKILLQYRGNFHHVGTTCMSSTFDVMDNVAKVIS